MTDQFTKYEIAGQDNWRVTESTKYGKSEELLFPTLEEAKVFIQNFILDGHEASELELAFIVPFAVNVTVEV